MDQNGYGAVGAVRLNGLTGALCGRSLSDCTVMENTPTENVVTICEAVRKYGVYS
ncbi:hypothetical protein LCGC14_0015830 [marine sediment metagenome]|uniref:Uncharacterized protein n=1 Tax=marine sediment metagenome TaxID=412755 RepID=A0A0F9YFY7_9ZZZZ